MNYEDLKVVINEILENENIIKNGLTIEYLLNERDFNNIYFEFIADMGVPPNNEVVVFEINVENLKIKCVKNVKER